MIQTAETSNGWIVGVGPFAEHAMGRCLRGQLAAGVPTVPWRTSAAQATPLHVLCWRSRYLPLTGRDADKQMLLDWARGGPGVHARILVGDAGSGKSRLAAEVADTLQQEGWSAGFVRWSDGRVWRAGAAGALLILDDPFPAEGRWWEEIERAIRETDVGNHTLRLLILSRDRWRFSVPQGGESDGNISFQELGPLSRESAAAIHHEAVARYAPERPVPRPEQSFEDWTASDPQVRLRPLYAIASAVSLRHAPWDEGYPADSRRVIVKIAHATRTVLDQEGAAAGLAEGVAPFVTALAAVREGLDEADLRSLAAATALTGSDADHFAACVKRLPAWSHDRLQADGDSLPQAEFVQMMLCEALGRGLGLRLGAAMHAAHLSQVAQLDRHLSDADAGADVSDQLARVISLADDRWLAHLESQPAAGSFIGRLALYAAERAAPPLPVAVADAATTEAQARQLMTLARQQHREQGPAAALACMEEAVKLYRHLAEESESARGDLLEALFSLAMYLQDVESNRAGDVWKERVAQARRSADESEVELSLFMLGECEWAGDEDRLAALRELAEIHREAGREIHLAVTLESLAAFAPVDEAIGSVFEADRIRGTLGSAGLVFPSSEVFDRLFTRFKDSHQAAALVIARLEVAQARRSTGVANRGRVALVTLARRLERVADVADAAEAREALQEALTLYRLAEALQPATGPVVRCPNGDRRLPERSTYGP